MPRRLRAPAVLLALAPLLSAAVVQAKPIAFAHGTTIMAEYGAGTMEELQVFYAPRYFLSLGGGYLAIESDGEEFSREIAYARVNYLVKRWNRARSQANVFVWGGAGSARASETRRDHFAWNTGAQVDWETRRVYTSFRLDYHDASPFSHRIDTLQLGLAPYEHDYDDLATWFVLQGRRFTGGIYDGTEVALLLRLFKGGRWLEAGATQDGKLQAMFMLNF